MGERREGKEEGEGERRRRERRSEGAKEGGEGEWRRQSADSEWMGRRNMRIHGPRIKGTLE